MVTAPKYIKMQVQKKRIDALDLLKSLAIYLVIWGHVIQHCLTSNPVDEPVYRFIYTFHMPLFMVLCGFFSWNSMKMGFWEMLKKKALTILLPSIVWGGIIFIIVSAVYIFEGKTESLSIFLFAKLLLTSYWFLNAVFFCYVIAWIGVNSKLYTPIWIILSVLLIQICPHFNMPLMYPCFLIGMFLKRIINKESFTKLRYLFLLIFIISICFWTKEYAGDYEQTLEAYSPFSIEFTKLLAFRGYKFIMGVCASFFLISIFRKHLWNFNGEYSKVSSLMTQCGLYSMGVYLVQTLLLGYILKKFISFDAMNSLLFNIVVAPVVSFFILIFIVEFIKLVNHKRWFSLLLFGTNYVGIN